jgi:hypothetical protein
VSRKISSFQSNEGGRTVTSMVIRNLLNFNEKNQILHLMCSIQVSDFVLLDLDALLNPRSIFCS